MTRQGLKINILMKDMLHWSWRKSVFQMLHLFYCKVSMRAAAARQHSVRHVIHLRGARTFLSNVLFPSFAAISGIIPVSATCVGIPLFSGTATRCYISITCETNKISQTERWTLTKLFSTYMFTCCILLA